MTDAPKKRRRLLAPIVAALALLCAALGYAGWRISAFHHNPLVRIALGKAEGNAAVLQALGRPLQSSLWYSGHLDDERADLELRVHGPLAGGRLQIQGVHVVGALKYSHLALTTDTGQDIDLMPRNH